MNNVYDLLEYVNSNQYKLLKKLKHAKSIDYLVKMTTMVNIFIIKCIGVNIDYLEIANKIETYLLLFKEHEVSGKDVLAWLLILLCSNNLLCI